MNNSYLSFYYMSSSKFQPTNNSYLFFYLNFMSSSKFQPTNSRHYPSLALSYVKWQVLTNEQLAFTFIISSGKFQQTNNL